MDPHNLKVEEVCEGTNDARGKAGKCPIPSDCRYSRCRLQRSRRSGAVISSPRRMAAISVTTRPTLDKTQPVVVSGMAGYNRPRLSYNSRLFWCHRLCNLQSISRIGKTRHAQKRIAHPHSRRPTDDETQVFCAGHRAGAGRPRFGPGGGQETQHPHHLGRRHRPVQRQRLQPWA